MYEEQTRRIEALEERVAKLERLAGLATVEPEPYRNPYVSGPPPIVVPRVEPQSSFAALSAPTGIPQPRHDVKSREDWEYQIGAKIGPVVGAVAVIAAIGYLVSLGISRGWITPLMIFSGACVLCLSFIGVGLWKRNEKEEFGQILVGIGSCGLYLNFAAGHVYQNLYGGEALVGLFLALSMTNLAYAFWRSSKPFLAIGVIGGFLAALMPLRDENVTINLLLHMLILVPASAIVARYRWVLEAAALYALGLILLLPAALIAGQGSTSVSATVYASALLLVSTFAWAGRELSPNYARPVPAVGLLLGALFGYLMRYDATGTAMVGSYGAGAIVLGRVLGPQLTFRSMIVGGVLSALVFAPFGTEPYNTLWIYLGLALAFGSVALRWFGREAGFLSLVSLALAVWNYAYLMTKDELSPTQEAWVIVVFAAALVVCFWSLVRSWKSFEPLLLAGTALMLPPVVRLVQLAVLSPALEGTLWQGIAAGFLAASLGLAALSWTVRSEMLKALLYAVLVTGLASYVFVLYDGAPASGAEFLLLTGYALASMTAVLLGSIDTPLGTRQALMSLGCFILGLLFTRGFYLAVGESASLTPDNANYYTLAPASVLLAMALFSLAAGIASISERFRDGTAGAVAFWLLAVGLVANHNNSILGFGAEISILLMLLAAVPFLTSSAIRIEPNPALYYASALGGWYLTNRLGYLLLGPQGLGMNANGAVTTAWILTGLVLLAVGFLRNVVELRLSCFIVLFSTVAKIVLVDLAETDQVIKVIILLLLGIVMLGGGYWYIRRSGVTQG